ncbi:MAG TPA: nucleotidyl transferase AbiEii/AbiGii toxin family protein [Vicinamibacteria bacterium]|nr:nucleotidyl transferase AbiEii/AbiGii toxin family protein [Vicinamibacteria bacterium]
MRLQLGVLGASQKTVLQQIGPFARLAGFYLAGGTGLALQLGHRRSVDFDWFRKETVGDPLQLASEITAAGIPFEPAATERGTLHGTVSRVRVSFIEYRYPLLKPPLEPSPDLYLASAEDIAAMKLAAVAQRGSRRDFVDVYALGQVLGLQPMLGSYQRKYGVRDVGHLLVALTYFDDADREPMPALRRDWTWTRIKAAIRSWVRAAAR